MLAMVVNDDTGYLTPRGACASIASVCQSLVHVSHEQTNRFVAVRFTFFCIQLLCFLALIGIAACYSL